MSSRLHSLLFAGGLCVVCSLLLTAASTGLQPYQLRNIQIDRQRNILLSVGLIQHGDAVEPDRIQQLYRENITSCWLDDGGRTLAQTEKSGSDLPIYFYVRSGAVAAYIVPINTRGLWGKIHGYLALESDGQTVAGFTVYKHAETPGLGGEIEKRWFQENFVGKKIVNEAGQFVSIKIAKGDVQKQVSMDKQVHYVDGISGATLTGQYLTAGLQDILRNYEPVSILFRKNETGHLTICPFGRTR